MSDGRALPPDWGIRGAYMPFAHAKLGGARLRWRSNASADVILPPEPGNMTGQYVVEMRRLGENMRLDPYDRRLTELVAEMRPVDPVALERTAMRARFETDPDTIDGCEMRYLAIVARATDRLARTLPGAGRVFSAEAGAPEADRIFMPTGMCAIDAVSRLEEYARAAAYIDRGRLGELGEFADRLRVVAENSVWTDAERVRQVHNAATLARREARRQVDLLELIETDPVAAIAADGPARAQRAAVRAAWWLDGWHLPIAVYAAVADDAKPELVEAALRTVIRMTPVVPANTDFMPERPGAAVAQPVAAAAAPRVSRSPTVRANVDWLTGRPAQQVLEDRTNWRQARG